MPAQVSDERSLEPSTSKPPIHRLYFRDRKKICSRRTKSLRKVIGQRISIWRSTKGKLESSARADAGHESPSAHLSECSKKVDSREEGLVFKKCKKIRFMSISKRPAAAAALEKSCFLTLALPTEVRIQIYPYLLPVEVDRGLGSTCKVLRNEIESSVSLWKEFCRRSGKLQLPLKPSVDKSNSAAFRALQLQRGRTLYHQRGRSANPYLTHYHCIPSVPLDFPSVDAALAAYRARPTSSSRRGMSKIYSLRVLRTPACTETASRSDFARGVYVSKTLAAWHWAQNPTELEDLVGMRSCVLRIEAPTFPSEGGGDDEEYCGEKKNLGVKDEEEGLWMHCKMLCPEMARTGIQALP